MAWAVVLHCIHLSGCLFSKCQESWPSATQGKGKGNLSSQAKELAAMKIPPYAQALPGAFEREEEAIESSQALHYHQELTSQHGS